MRKPSELAITIIATLVLIIGAVASVLIANAVKAHGDDDPPALVAPSPGIPSPGIPSPSASPEDSVPPASSETTPPASSEATETGELPPPEPEATPDPSSLPTPAQLDITEVSATTAPEAAAESLMNQLATVLPQEGAIGEDLQLIAIDALAEQLQVLADEYADHGWTASGQTQVLSVEVTELPDDAFQVAACIDSSRLTVTDQGGNIVSDQDSAPTLNEYTMKRENNRWVLTDQTFPENPDCN